MRQWIVGVVALLCAATFVEAQTGTAELRGRVIDAQQGAMPGVNVVVRNQESGLFRETTSGADGSFFVSAMTPGVYQVEAKLDGFRTYQRGDIRLEVGRAASLDVTMELGGVAEVVTVTGEAPLVDTTSKEVGGNINSEEFVDTPSFNRDFTGILGMLPGVVSTPQATTFGAAVEAGGQNTRNVSYSLDGADNNDGLSRGSQGSQARVPLEAIQEFKLLTSQYDAEFGSASGGVVNAVSKQGTNLFHGSAFEFFQDQRLSARDFFVKQNNLTEAPAKQNQFGGTIGGPIVKDKAHFFFSLERIILDPGFTMNVPGRPDLNGTSFGSSRVWNTFIRFDNQINSNNTWGVRWLRDSSPQPLQLSTTWTRSRGGAETDVDQTVVGTLNSVVGATKVNTFRVSRVSENLLFGNPIFNNNGLDQRAVPAAQVYTSYEDGGSIEASQRDLYSYIADDTFSWFVPSWGGSHEFKFGFSYNYTPLRLQNSASMNGSFAFNSNIAFNPAIPSTYPERLTIRVPGKSDFRNSGTYVGMFAQDKWKIGSDLTISLGVRYDLEKIGTPNENNGLFDDGSSYPVDLNNVSPRVGFSYALDSQGTSSIRGGVGLFYQQTGLAFVNNMFSDGKFSNSFLVSFPNNNIDPGPRSGNLPTDPMLVNGPVVNQALLQSLYPTNSGAQLNRGVVYLDNPDRTVPYSRQYSAGYSTQLGSTFAVSADYIRSESRDQYMYKDLNPATRTGTLATGAITRNTPLLGTVGEFVNRVNLLVNEGYINYDSLQIAVTKRLSQGFNARLSYALSKGRGNLATGQADVINSQFGDQLRLDREVGPTAVDRPHIFSLNTFYAVPKTGGLTFSGVVQARSGTPFSLINSANDADQNGITLNEYLPAGTYSGTGLNTISVENKGGRNGARGPNYFSLDLRTGYQFRLPGGRTLDAHIDVFNITDHVNFANPSGDQRVANTFLKLTGITGATRSAQVNFRYAF